jgi:hypothetical protein
VSYFSPEELECAMNSVFVKYDMCLQVEGNHLRLQYAELKLSSTFVDPCSQQTVTVVRIALPAPPQNITMYSIYKYESKLTLLQLQYNSKNNNKKGKKKQENNLTCEVTSDVGQSTKDSVEYITDRGIYPTS